jgi:hypothetical protein
VPLRDCSDEFPNFLLSPHIEIASLEVFVDMRTGRSEVGEALVASGASVHASFVFGTLEVGLQPILFDELGFTVFVCAAPGIVVPVQQSFPSALGDKVRSVFGDPHL